MIPKLLAFVAISICIYFLIAGVLILSQPVPDPQPQVGLDFEGVMARGAFVDPDGAGPAFRHDTFQTADGVEHPVTIVEGATDGLPLIVALHGSAWHGQQFDRLAWGLRDVAEVRALTLRGHGPTPVRRGDVDYVGQLEDDIAALIAQTRRDGQRVVLLGHSSGGGLAIRFARGDYGKMIDAAILLAPYLHHTAPTMRENSGSWTRPLVRRLIGLSMLNMARVTAFNHLTVIQFSMPQAVLDGPQGHMATTAYSFRLNTSFAPRLDYLNDIAALPPFLLVAGVRDEAFFVHEYEPTLSEMTDKGRYHLVDGVGHLDIVDAPATQTLIRDFLRGL